LLKSTSTQNEHISLLNLTSYYQHHCLHHDDSHSTTSNDDCLPFYLFANEQQDVVKKLRGSLIQAISSFIVPTGSPTTEDEGECNLWNLLMISTVMKKEDIQEYEILKHCFFPASSHTTASSASINPSDASSSSPAEKESFHETIRTYLMKSLPTLGKFQFFAGTPLTGAPMHSHGPAFNFLIQGKKIWNLLPPGRDLYSTIHPIEWYANNMVNNEKEYPYYNSSSLSSLSSSATSDIASDSANSGKKSQPLCRYYQDNHQILFVPRHWTHQVSFPAASFFL
jgi:hypothetical protein